MSSLIPTYSRLSSGWSKSSPGTLAVCPSWHPAVSWTVTACRLLRHVICHSHQGISANCKISTHVYASYVLPHSMLHHPVVNHFPPLNHWMFQLLTLQISVRWQHHSIPLTVAHSACDDHLTAQFHWLLNVPSLVGYATAPPGVWQGLYSKSYQWGKNESKPHCMGGQLPVCNVHTFSFHKCWKLCVKEKEAEGETHHSYLYYSGHHWLLGFARLCLGIAVQPGHVKWNHTHHRQPQQQHVPSFPSLKFASQSLLLWFWSVDILKQHLSMHCTHHTKNKKS